MFLSGAAVQRKLDGATLLRVEDREYQEACAIALRADRSVGSPCGARHLLTGWMIFFDNLGRYGLGLTLWSCSNANASRTHGGWGQ